MVLLRVAAYAVAVPKLALNCVCALGGRLLVGDNVGEAIGVQIGIIAVEIGVVVGGNAVVSEPLKTGLPSPLPITSPVN